MVRLQFPDILYHKQAFGLRVKIGYSLFWLERGTRIFHPNVGGDAASVGIHVNTKHFKMLFFAGFGYLMPSNVAENLSLLAAALSLFAARLASMVGA